MKQITIKSILDQIRHSMALFAVMPLLMPQMAITQAYQAPLISTPTSVVYKNLWPQYDTYFDTSDARWSRKVVVTAYNSEVGQTDDSPFIAAWGTRVYDGMIATNDLPRGTRVRFPDIYGSRVFVVDDRMNSRYTGTGRVDIWMVEKSDAINFGAKYLTMEVL
jgi:3D (Asp-Asp-Asp) domain-containing protein